MLDERKSAVLRAVIESYIATAQPVGSGHVAATAGLQVSPATVRNDMAALEAEGYLRQPHTSAGRVPTDKGYRLFVDHLGATAELATPKREVVADFFARSHGQLESMLAETSRLLAHLTDTAAVVVGPELHEPATIRSFQLVSLAPRIVLAVVVLGNGEVERRTLECDRDVDEAEVAEVSLRLARVVIGRSMADLPEAPVSGEPSSDQLAAAGLMLLRTGRPADEPHVFVQGAARVAASFDAIDTVHRVLTMLEEQYLMVTLIRDVIDRGLAVSIGAEHGVESLAECSLVVAPYTVDGETAGSIAVLGPTRMDYAQALAAVAVVGNHLGHHLSDADGSPTPHQG